MMTSRSGREGAFEALVLAASRGEATRLEFGVLHKCTLEVAGRPMLMRVLEALTAAEQISAMAISIDAPQILNQIPGYNVLQKKQNITVLKSASSASLSAAEALEKLKAPLLVTTADNVLLTPAITDEFLKRAAGVNADLVVGLVARDTIEAAFPGSRRTYWKFRGGAYTGCNLFALMSHKSRSVVELWQHTESNRKKPWKIASLFGAMNLLGFLLKIWSLEDALARLSKHLGLKIVPVILPHAQIAIDVDKREHLKQANVFLR